MADLPDFGAWYREQHPQVLAAITVASTNTDLAAEATDEAFVRAYERWERVRRMDSPGGWLYRVAFNDMRRRQRRKAVERQLLARGKASQHDVVSAPVALDPQVWAAVRTLPQRQRTAVALRYVLDLTEAEVARVMGVSRGAVSASLTTARKRLETLLAEEAHSEEAAPEDGSMQRGDRSATPAHNRRLAGAPPEARSALASTPEVSRG